MPRYRICGTHRESGRRIKPTVLDADDVADARWKAERAGVEVAGVEPMPDEDRPVGPNDATDSYRALGSPSGG